MLRLLEQLCCLKYSAACTLLGCLVQFAGRCQAIYSHGGPVLYSVLFGVTGQKVAQDNHTLPYEQYLALAAVCAYALAGCGVGGICGWDFCL